MSVISMKQLLEAGVHFGHQTRRWNPKMAEYIFAERNGIYIIDLQKTVKKVDEAYAAICACIAEGGEILFVGTKKQAQECIREEAERCGMYYVNQRWLGGMLTNFTTIKTRIARLKNLEKMQEDGTFDVLPKKEVAKLMHEMEKLQKNVGGIKEMKKVPDMMFIVDTKKERCFATKHSRRVEWLRNHIEDVKEYYKLNKDSLWDVVGIFIVSEPLLSNEVYHKGLNIISRAELSVEKIRSIRK